MSEVPLKEKKIPNEIFYPFSTGGGLFAWTKIPKFLEILLYKLMLRFEDVLEM